jgi:hypothetical protein
MALSSLFSVNGLSTVQAYSVAYDATVTFVIQSLTGITSISWSIVGTSKSDQAALAITLSGTPTGATASVVMPANPGDGLGRAFAIKLTVSNAQESSTTYRVFGVANSAGIIPGVAGEELWRNATHGYIDIFNQALNAIGGAAGSSGQLLYNNSGAIDGASGISITGSELNLSFAASSSTPTIEQTSNATATETTRRVLTIKGQLKTGNTSTIGGTVRIEGGSATGAGGTHVGGWLVLAGGSAPGASGTRNGGDVSIYGGTGGTRYGNVFIGTDYDPATWNWQGMGRGIFVQDMQAEPSADLSSGFAMWSQSGRPKFRFNSTTLRFDGTAATASAGGATLPATPQGFVTVQLNGTERKIPYYVT